jgi:hypothetical protein
MNLSQHASTIAQIVALFLVCATVVVLALFTHLSEGLMGMLIGAVASGLGAISGFSRHPPDIPPGMTSQETLIKATPPTTTKKEEIIA